MDQARFLQRVRMNQFKKVYDRWKQKKLTQKEAAEQLGTSCLLSSLNFIYTANSFFKIPPRFSLYRFHFSSLSVYAASCRGFLNSLSKSSPFSRMAQATDKRRSHTVRTDLQ